MSLQVDYDMIGMVFDIQKFSVHDGPGIRTAVFLKGCPLGCVWCHNPEALQKEPQIFFFEKNCVSCGACTAACARGCHVIKDGVHTFLRERCVACGSCAEVCTFGAVEKTGVEMRVSQVIHKVEEDVVFYRHSGGGMTLTGGEPMFQPDFARNLAMAAKEKNISTAMETCGYCERETLLTMLDYIDLFLFDYKLTGDLHCQYTGRSQSKILNNLYALDREGGKLVLRCPLLPDLNDTEAHLRGIADTAHKLKNLLEIHLEPYHPFGISKRKSLGMPVLYDHADFLEETVAQAFAVRLSALTDIPVKIM